MTTRYAPAYFGSAMLPRAFSNKPPRGPFTTGLETDDGEFKEKYTSKEFEEFLGKSASDYEKTFGGSDLDNHIEKLFSQKLS